jgi:hypothetical protein
MSKGVSALPATFFDAVLRSPPVVGSFFSPIPAGDAADLLRRLGPAGIARRKGSRGSEAPSVHVLSRAVKEAAREASGHQPGTGSWLRKREVAARGGGSVTRAEQPTMVL